MKVLQIGTKDTYALRQKVLRPGRSLEECHFKGDDADQTFHLGAFVDNKLVSVASFYYERNPAFEDEDQYRLRGMATYEEHRGSGLSRALLRTAFPLIKQNFCSLVWCNARISAQGFYEKTGFTTHGEQFDVPEIGPHLLMFRKI
ncbi:MAG: GNAT family N-acetyltransferase [Halobacteriovorax sp.]|nr:GNAT family N-acetyltransferase [Halobacteriovorax sp.]